MIILHDKIGFIQNVCQFNTARHDRHTFLFLHLKGNSVVTTDTDLVPWSWVCLCDRMKLVHVDAQQYQGSHKFTLLAIPDGILSTRRRKRCQWAIMC